MTNAPDRGDLVWLSLQPQAGREQGGRRPVLVLSSREYNAKRGLMIGCPITSKVKGYPFEVPLGPGSGVAGVVLADHVKSFDFRARRVEAIGSTPQATVDAVAQIVAALIGIV